MDGVVIRTTGHVAGGKTDKSAAQYAPYISPDTNTWWQYNKETQMFEDTGIVPYGLKGEKGDPGDDYILTEEDKEEIIAAIRAVVVVDSDTVNGHHVEADVPEDAVFTDTTYDPATQSSSGLMSAQDKTRLDTLNTKVINTTGFATCSTAAGTAAKTATITGFTLATGATVRIKFSNTNTAASPSLNVNSTGAKPIKLYGTTAAGTTPSTSWNAGEVVELVYDGTNWLIQNRAYPDATTSASGLMSASDKSKLDAIGTIIDAEWTATSSSASLTTLTESVSLSPGTWLMVAVTPISDNADMVYAPRAISGSTDIGSNVYFGGFENYNHCVLPFKVTSTANVVIRTGRATSVNFTYPERGGVRFVKLAS